MLIKSTKQWGSIKKRINPTVTYIKKLHEQRCTKKTLINEMRGQHITLYYDIVIQEQK